jgi:beta-N-acetylhexosaminidase
LPQKAAQLVVAPTMGFDAAALRPVLATGVGGVLMLGNDVPGDLAGEIAAAQRAAAVPLLVMADQEGGGVQRLGAAVTSLPWPREMAASTTPAQVQSAASRLGRQMRALGVNVDLAPVLDVDARPGPSSSNPDGKRSFSGDPAVAAAYGTAFVRGLAGHGLAVAKHFPGLGGSTGNTDYGAGQTLPLSKLEQQALPVFAAAISAGVPAVMVANAAVPGIGATPASLSSTVIDGLLRQRLGFTGLVVTDSLSAGAISAAGYDVPHATVAAIRAGADVVLFGSTLTSQQKALLAPDRVAGTVNDIVRQLVAAVHDGTLPQNRLDAAAAAVARAKTRDLCAG